MKNKILCVMVYSAAAVARFILFFAEKRYSKEYRGNNHNVIYK
ncbi:hypothetical protein V8V74_27345 [Niallia taxi]